MFFLKEWITSSYTREELTTDAGWIFLLVCAICFQFAIFKSLVDFTGGIPLFAIGTGFLLLGLLQFFWLRFPAMAFCAMLAIADFAMRRRPLAVFLMLIALFYTFQMAKTLTLKKKSADTPPPAETPAP